MAAQEYATDTVARDRAGRDGIAYCASDPKPDRPCRALGSSRLPVRAKASTSIRCSTTNCITDATNAAAALDGAARGAPHGGAHGVLLRGIAQLA